MTSNSTPKRWLAIPIVVIAMGTNSPATAKTIHVDANAMGANNGSSWINAYHYLQDALTAADSSPKPVEIRVAQGIYKPDQGVGKTPGDRTASFYPMNGVTIKGGFAGIGRPDPDARDVKLYETILSGDLDSNDVGDINDLSRNENSYHVINACWRDETTVFDGFTISAGNAAADAPYGGGGGMVCGYGSPTVIDCTFIGNRAISEGGGIKAWDGSRPKLINCTFKGNSAGYRGGGIEFLGNAAGTLTNCVFIENWAGWGGGMCNTRSSPTLTNCTFTDNSAGDGAGGMHNEDFSEPKLTNCRFERNLATFHGGGMCNTWSSSTMLTNCFFGENRAGSYGGGIENYDSSPILTNCNFIKNSAGETGGGVANAGWGGTPSNPTLTNCLFVENFSEREGAGISNIIKSNPSVRNCTFSANVSTIGAGAIDYGAECGGTVTNCILWDNVPNGYEIGLNTDTPPVVTYSNVQGGWPGVGNIDFDPLFVNPLAENYHLGARSPCIDAGDPCYIPTDDEKDMDSGSRVVNGRIEMGVDEFTGGPPIIRVSSSIVSNICNTYYANPLTPQTTRLSSSRFVFADGKFVSFIGGPAPEPLTLNIQNIGPGTLAWEMTENCPWLEVVPQKGESAGEIDEVTLQVDTSGMSRGLYSCELTVSAPGAVNSPLRVPVDIYFLTASHDEEFVGPFPSWLDVKTDYGAVGDGMTDDTAAIQKALDQIRLPDSKRKVVYFPSGIYRITNTLRLERQTHHEAMGVGIIGEDPGTTTIVWDGLNDGVMFFYNAWFARMSRFTFDGKGKANIAIRHGPAFTTHNEFSDMVFKDVALGIEGGDFFANGIAETAVIRCRFLRCSTAGIALSNWNSLDWWIWYCVFENCHVGVTNHPCAGNFHVYESFFFNSNSCDIVLGNLDPFSIRNNTSMYSRMFFYWCPWSIGSWLTLQGNTIIEPDGEAPICIGTAGPNLVLDNVIKTRADRQVGPVIRHRGWSDSDFVCVGNTYTVENPVLIHGRLRTLDEKVVPSESLHWDLPAIPGTPPNRHRQVFEVAAGTDASVIQTAIDGAAKLSGQRPVVHLPAGIYLIDKTIIIPGRCDLQLIGEGLVDGTELQWVGSGEGPILRLMSPARATLREFNLNEAGRGADDVVIEDCDQPGARVFMNQVDGSSGQAGLLVDGLRYTDVSLHNYNHGTNKVGVKVVGADDAEPNDGGRVVIFSGSSGGNNLSYDVTNGGHLLVRDIWCEESLHPRYVNLTGSGELTLHNVHAVLQADDNNPAIVLDDFSGKVSLLNVALGSYRTEVPVEILLQGLGKGTNLLALGVTMGVDVKDSNYVPRSSYFMNHSPYARYALLNSSWHLGDPSGQQSWKMVPDEGTDDPNFLREMLAQTRKERPRLLTAIPDSVTDARFYRIYVCNHGAFPSSGVAIHLKGKHPKGDINQDYRVDAYDLARLIASWLDECNTLDWCNGCDLDRSGQVNLSDFAILADSWLEDNSG